MGHYGTRVYVYGGGSQDGLIGKKLGTAIYGSQVRASLSRVYFWYGPIASLSLQVISFGTPR